jgi:demethylspheroidene O-methyltransferase
VAAVFRDGERGSELLFIERARREGDPWSGHMALPGGRVDPDDEHALAILKAARAALPSGGTVLVAEPMAQTPGAHAMGDAYFGFYLLAMGRGEARSVDDMRRLLGLAGFQDIRPVKTRLPLQAGVVVARAP